MTLHTLATLTTLQQQPKKAPDDFNQQIYISLMSAHRIKDFCDMSLK
jgi:hypothetical protein